MQRLFVAVLTVASVVIYSWLCMLAIPLLALRMEPVLVVPGGPHKKVRTTATTCSDQCKGKLNHR